MKDISHTGFCPATDGPSGSYVSFNIKKKAGSFALERQSYFLFWGRGQTNDTEMMDFVSLCDLATPVQVSSLFAKQ